MRKVFLTTAALVITGALLLTGCKSTASTTDTTTTSGTQAETTASDTSTDEIQVTDTIHFSYSDTDLDASETDGTLITLADNGSSSDSDSVTVEGNVVTITEEGTYLINGSLSDGQLVVQADKEAKVKLILNGVTISNSTTSAINIQSADKVVITLADGTTNTVSDTTAYDAEDTSNACIYSSDDLTFNGTGTLVVKGNGNNGIGCKNDLRFVSGTYEITAVNNAMKGNGSVVVKDGTFTIDSGDDGIKSDEETDAAKGYVYLAGGTFNITAGDDGIQAFTAIVATGGTYTFEVTGKKTNCDTLEDIAEGLM